MFRRLNGPRNRAETCRTLPPLLLALDEPLQDGDFRKIMEETVPFLEECFVDGVDEADLGLKGENLQKKLVLLRIETVETSMGGGFRVRKGVGEDDLGVIYR